MIAGEIWEYKTTYLYYEKIWKIGAGLGCFVISTSHNPDLIRFDYFLVWSSLNPLNGKQFNHYDGNKLHLILFFANKTGSFVEVRWWSCLKGAKTHESNLIIRCKIKLFSSMNQMSDFLLPLNYQNDITLWVIL